MDDLRVLSNDELLLGLESLVGSQRQLLARLIAYLREVEERRLHLELAYSSMFEFCTRKLRMSEGEAFRRITAARLAKRFPIVIELISSGTIHLSALVLLRDHLTSDNHAELLSEACGKGKAAILALLAARFPKPDVASKIRKLPSAQPPAATTQQAGELPLEGSQPAPRKPANGELEPLSVARYKVQFTAGQELKDKLERAKNLLSHANPSGDLAVVLERALDLLLVELEKKKLGKSKRPRRARGSKPGSVARARRGEVFERDGEQCSFVGPDGRRCEATAFLEIDHIESRALGGSDENHNLRILCRAHNRLWAEQTFGKEHVEERIRFRQRKCKRRKRAVDREAPKIAQHRRAAAARDRDETYDKLLYALTKLGFGRQDTCAVLDELRAGHTPVAWEAPLDELVRAALQMLTK